MGQCCLGGETEKKSLDEKVNNEAVKPDEPVKPVEPVGPVKSVKPKSNHLFGVNPAANAKSRDVRKSLVKTSAKSATVPLKSKSKVESVMSTTLISKEPSKLKMERVKVKIVVDEQRIMQNIKEKATMRAELAKIGQRARSATSSSLSPGSLKSPKRSAPAPQSKDKPKSKPKSSLKSVSNSKSQSGPNCSTMSVDFNSLQKPHSKASGSTTGNNLFANKPTPSAIGNSTSSAKSTSSIGSSHSKSSSK